MNAPTLQILNPFGCEMTVTPQPGWMHIRILEKEDAGPKLAIVGANGEISEETRTLILPEGDTKNAMRVAAVVLATAEPLGDKDRKLEVGETVMFAPIVRPVPIPWAPLGTEMLIRYECVVATLTKLEPHG